MPSELPRFAFIYGGKWWSLDFKLGKGLEYLTGTMQIFLLTLSSLGSSAQLDLIFFPLVVVWFFFCSYMTLSLFSPSLLAECTWLFCFPECMESHCCLATSVSLSPWIFPFFLPFLAYQEEHFSCLPLSPALPVCLLFWLPDSWTPALALTPLFGDSQLGSSGSCTGGFSAVGMEHSIGKMIMVTFLWGCNLTVCTCFATLLVTFRLFQ